MTPSKPRDGPETPCGCGRRSATVLGRYRPATVVRRQISVAYRRGPQAEREDVYVYFVTTRQYAELIARDGFRDDYYGAHDRGVMVQRSAACPSNENLAIIVVLLDDDELEPYVHGEIACVPARLLNAGYAALID